MYNGIGLPTARGSGTNGYVQKNLAHVRKTRALKSSIVSEPDRVVNKGPSFDIILHQKKRQIESKCLQFRKELEEEGWRPEKIDIEINHYRQRKLDELAKMTESDREDRLKRSFGINKDYVEGSAVTQMKRRDKDHPPAENKDNQAPNREEEKAPEIKVKSEIKQEVKKEKRDRD